MYPSSAPAPRESSPSFVVADVSYAELQRQLASRQAATGAILTSDRGLVRIALGERWVTVQRHRHETVVELVYARRSAGLATTGWIQIWEPRPSHRWGDLVLGAKLVASQMIAFLVGAIAHPTPMFVDRPWRT